MSWYTFSLMVLVQSVSVAALSAPWPFVDNPRIVSCKNHWLHGECSDQVVYGSDGVVFVDIVPVGRPDPARGTQIRAVGMHCDYGSMLTGQPFGGCRWGPPGTRHYPWVTGKCELINTDSWELTADSTCATGQWTQHIGAGPGGECVIFTQQPPGITATMNTPFGVLDAETVANSGNRFCQKALPPSVQCDLDIPTIIDHHTLPQQGSDSVTVFGSIACGAKPVVEIVGGSVVVLGVGVKSRLSTNVTSATTVTMTSDLTVTNAAPGEYRGSAVVRVSPY
ncbi:Uncharacterised protein [Serratia marcescens]|nr:hypothetical protein DP21_507 [Serratia marcescens]CAI1016639.1 Uncharacterised protein [Serratia marcescens]CAI1964660.1 Uncharacterised protein [Serratia marcescens]